MRSQGGAAVSRFLFVPLLAGLLLGGIVSGTVFGVRLAWAGVSGEFS